MNTHKSGRDIATVFSLAADDGVLAPTALRRRVLDEEGNLIADWAAVTLPDAGVEEVTVETGAPLNTLVPPQLRGIRIVELEITTAASTTVVEVAYQLEASLLLVPGINSFQTYYQAVLEAQTYSDTTMQGWVQNTDKEARERALSEAFTRIRLMPVVIDWESDQSIIRDVYSDPPRLRDLTSELILRLDKRLAKALKQAQLLEANHVLTDDQFGAARAAGIQSMTVGESSQFFGNTRPLDRGVCEAAAKVLARWVRNRARIGRA